MLGRTIAYRNVKVRIVACDISAREIAEIMGITRVQAAKYFQCSTQEQLYWTADCLVIPPEVLIHPDLRQVAGWPVPPPGWLPRIKPYVGQDIEYDQLALLAWDGWQEEPWELKLGDAPVIPGVHEARGSRKLR